MHRRRFLETTGALSLAALAGCAGSDEPQGDESPEPATETAEPDTTTTPDASAYEIRVDYTGSWQGAYSIVWNDGSTNSASFSASATTLQDSGVEIGGDASIISANAQKQDDSNGQLVIAILERGDIITESSTSSPYGVAQASTSL